MRAEDKLDAHLERHETKGVLREPPSPWVPSSAKRGTKEKCQFCNKPRDGGHDKDCVYLIALNNLVEAETLGVVAQALNEKVIRLERQVRRLTILRDAVAWFIKPHKERAEGKDHVLCCKLCKAWDQYEALAARDDDED